MKNRTTLVLACAADVLAAVPYLIGFHPTDSIIVVCIHSRRITFVGRFALPRDHFDELPGYLAEAIGRQRAKAAIIIGYGPARRMDPVMYAIRDAHPVVLPQVELYDLLRVTGGRYWSYLYTGDDDGGTPYQVGGTRVAVEATRAGMIAMPDRDAFADLLAPVKGRERVAMRQATTRASRRFSKSLNTFDQASARLAAGRAALRTALRRHRRGNRLSDDEAAWLTVLLRDLTIRDLAWESMKDMALHVNVWTDITRRAQPNLTAAPASLLAFAAWYSGDGTLASTAVARALSCEPGYSMALTIRDMLDSALPPSALEGWPPPPDPEPAHELIR